MKEDRNCYYSKKRKIILFIVFVFLCVLLFNSFYIKSYAAVISYDSFETRQEFMDEFGITDTFGFMDDTYFVGYVQDGSTYIVSSNYAFTTKKVYENGAYVIYLYNTGLYFKYRFNGTTLGGNWSYEDRNVIPLTTPVTDIDYVYSSSDLDYVSLRYTSNDIVFNIYKLYSAWALHETTYLYDSSIPNVTNLSMKKHSLYELGHLVIGESKTKLDISWDVPNDNYLLEIMVKSALNERVRVWRYQTYQYHYLDLPITSQSGGYTFDITALGRQCLKSVWSDVDTGSWISLPVTELYYRYVKLDTVAYKALYGNWTKLDLISGNVGYEEAKRNIVTTTETIDPVTNDVVINDTVVDGTTTDYINSQGNEINENESLEYGLFEMQDGLNDASNTIKNVGSWLGDLPIFIGSLFAFLPTEILAFISLGIIVVIVLRVAGR